MTLDQVFDRGVSIEDREDKEEVHHGFDDRLSDTIRLVWHDTLNEHANSLIGRF